MRMMQDSNGFKEEALFLSADELQLVKWYVDASFAVHGDFRSHTDDAMTYGTDVPISISRKQKWNTTGRSSTEAKLVAVDLILWTRLFFDEQRLSRFSQCCASRQ
jgi:hypothetical protein